VVDVFGLVVGSDVLEGSDVAEALLHLEEFFAGEDSGGFDSACVGDAGFDLVGEEAPIEGEGTLPGFEGGIEGLAEATGPHLCGLLFIRLTGHLDLLLVDCFVRPNIWKSG
jgi:hypothetical protein